MSASRGERLVAISPMTPVSFGDGRPNVAGESRYGSSRFPPSPRTVQGLIRTTLLRSVKDLWLGRGADTSKIESLVGPPERLPKGWQIAGPWPAVWTEQEDGLATELKPWLPCPGWVQADRDRYLSFRKWHELGRSGQENTLKVLTDLSDSNIAGLLTGRGGFVRGWVGPDVAWKIVRGEPLRQLRSFPLPPFVAKEPHTGLVLDPSRRAAEAGMLYTLDYYRFSERSGIVARFEGEIQPPLSEAALSEGASNLGRKNRVARLLRVENWCSTFQNILEGRHIPAKIRDGERFWIWATTPVLAQDPLAPGIEGLEHRGARLEVQSAAIGYPEPIGGFSLAKGRSSESKRYLPGGSAWLVEVRGGNEASRRDLLMQIHDTCCLGDDAADKSFGFGHALVANLPRTWRMR